MKDNVSDLLQKEVSRKEFLSTIGIGLAALVGISGVLRMMGHSSFARKADSGYGSSPYGR